VEWDWSGWRPRTTATRPSFPFADPTSVGGYLDFEKAVYDNVSVRKAA
jgi:hypothetical protein